MRILVVDDAIKIANFVKCGLEEENYEVDVVHDGEDGFLRVLNGAYGLVILDAVLSKKDGLALVRDLRSQKILIPIMMLTVKNSVENIVAGLDAGADDYLAKPFAFAELLARVKALQRRSEQDRGATLFFADLHLDPVLHKVWRNGKLLDLSVKEYQLLELFVRHPNQVVTRQMIADEVWQGGLSKFTNVIEVYVKYLRRKLDRCNDKNLIHTVRGCGYVLRKEG